MADEFVYCWQTPTPDVRCRWCDKDRPPTRCVRFTAEDGVGVVACLDCLDALPRRLAKAEHEVAALTAAVANLADAVKLVAKGA